LENLRERGFDVTLIEPERDGTISVPKLAEALRDDTLLVSVMHVNNETDIIQPLGGIAAVLNGHEAFFHVDAAQGFGKEIPALKNPRIDFISLSGHKIFAPKGIGALIMRRRGSQYPPVTPL
jgi:cysteine desulfurase